MKYLKVAVFGLVFLAISALVFVGVSVPPKTELLENQNTAFVLPENLDEKVFSLDGSWGFVTAVFILHRRWRGQIQ